MNRQARERVRKLKEARKITEASELDDVVRAADAANAVCGAKCMSLSLQTIEDHFGVLEEGEYPIPLSLQRLVTRRFVFEYTDLRKGENWIKSVWPCDKEGRDWSVNAGPSFASCGPQLDDAEDVNSFSETWYDTMLNDKFLSMVQDMPNGPLKLFNIVTMFTQKLEVDEEDMEEGLVAIVLHAITSMRGLNTLTDHRPMTAATASQAIKDVAFIAPIDKDDRKTCFSDVMKDGRALQAAMHTDYWKSESKWFREFVGREARFGPEFFEIENLVAEIHNEMLIDVANAADKASSLDLRTSTIHRTCCVSL